MLELLINAVKSDGLKISDYFIKLLTDKFYTQIEYDKYNRWYRIIFLSN